MSFQVEHRRECSYQGGDSCSRSHLGLLTSISLASDCFDSRSFCGWRSDSCGLRCDDRDTVATLYFADKALGSTATQETAPGSLPMACGLAVKCTPLKGSLRRGFNPSAQIGRGFFPGFPIHLIHLPRDLRGKCKANKAF
jgi:hypothetical protein